MATKTYSIHEIAGEFDRLFPDQVDTTTAGNGEYESGHNGHEHDGEESDTVGWFADGGNVGHPVMDVRRADVQLAGETLAALEPVRSLSDVERALADAGVRYERRV